MCNTHQHKQFLVVFHGRKHHQATAIDETYGPLDKRMLRQSEQERKAFKQEFVCDVDAQRAFDQWESKQPYLKAEITIIKVPVFTGAGRPSLNQKPKRE